mgnify:CR=1 FL=1
MNDFFDLSGNVTVITGGAGFLGTGYAQAIAAYGGIPVILDLHGEKIAPIVDSLKKEYHVDASGYVVDITEEDNVAATSGQIVRKYGRVDVLINNAANNPRVDTSGVLESTTRLENFPLQQWHQDIAVGLTGAFLCAKYFGLLMAERGSGVIINVSSDLGVIAPDQRLYRTDGLSEEEQNVKPVTYSVVKTGLIGLTRYLATYWAEKGVRCNAICPGGVFNGQGEPFLSRVNSLIPLGRMANLEELQGAIIFLASCASSYMNGAVLIVDGGRSCW